MDLESLIVKLMKSNAASYKKAAILTASPERLILMLYDGALDAMGRAKSGFEIEELKSVTKRSATI
jgi:flagellin-specific chaperone FliS